MKALSPSVLPPDAYVLVEQSRTKSPLCLRVIGVLGFVALMTLVGCASDDDDGAGPVSCAGASCMCVSDACECSSGDDCHASCGASACSLGCAMGTKCVADSTAAVTIDCAEAAECKGNGGPRSVIDCDGSAKCELKAGASSEATCRNGADCKLNLGAGSSVACLDTSTCDIKCDGDCSVTCSSSATGCAVACGLDAPPGVDCADGRFVCGEC